MYEEKYPGSCRCPPFDHAIVGIKEVMDDGLVDKCSFKWQEGYLWGYQLMDDELVKKCTNKTIVLKTECSDSLNGKPFCLQNYEVQNSNGTRIDEPSLNQLGKHGQDFTLK